MKTTIISCALLALTGCATTHYVNDSGQEASAQDIAACNYEARKATAGIMNGFQAGWEQAELRHECLTVKGYARKRI